MSRDYSEESAASPLAAGEAAKPPAAMSCACGAAIDLQASVAACTECDKVFQIDDVGVVRMADVDVEWRALPAEFRPAVATAASKDEVLDAMLDAGRGWPHALQRRLMHPRQAAAAALVSPRRGEAALDLATGWAMLPTALASLGMRVFSADWCYLRLRFSCLMNEIPPERAVHVGRGARLPWRDGSFAYVFADLRERSLLRQAFGRDRRPLLEEIRRLLKPGGAIVLGGSALLGGAVMPLRRDVRNAGFGPHRLVLATPGLDAPTRLIPSDDATRSPAGEAAPVPRKSLRRMAKTLAESRFFLRDRYLIAGTGKSGPPNGLLEALTDGAPPVIRTLSGARVAAFAGSRFVKAPLSPDQRDQLVTEAEKTRRALDTPFAPMVIEDVKIRRRDGVLYATYPLIKARATSRSEVDSFILHALRSADSGQMDRLDGTAFWSRLASERGAADAADHGAADLRSIILDRLGEARVPVGPTHGDLHKGNVMFRRDGPPILVDWNRSELRNPLLIDATYTALKGEMEANRTDLADAVVALLEERTKSGVAQRARRLTGDLDMTQAAAVAILDRIMSYGGPRRRNKPWKVPALAAAAQVVKERMDEAQQ
jgi:hypothetical protein